MRKNELLRVRTRSVECIKGVEWRLDTQKRQLRVISRSVECIKIAELSSDAH